MLVTAFAAATAEFAPNTTALSNPVPTVTLFPITITLFEATLLLFPATNTLLPVIVFGSPMVLE